MVVGRNNGVVGLTRFSNKRMCGLLFGPQKSGRNKGVVVWRVSTVASSRNRQLFAARIICGPVSCLVSAAEEKRNASQTACRSAGKS